ncbi:hypothetical protein [Micromonospora musae]|uniref:hypothetical protein n=1 Tax=Micromonospora musae TaxID=1894970 RepID=UPI0011C3FEE9|nr:hypothetical protein [Micromonospora musae]
MDTERTAEAIQRYVLSPAETVEKIWQGPTSVTVRSSRYRYAARPADWAVADEGWVSEAVRVVASGQPIYVTHGLLLPVDGESLHLNRPEVMAELGRRVGAGLSPLAYAELFGELYSVQDIDGPVVYSFGATESARAGWLVREADHFARVLVVPDAPAVAPPVFEQGPGSEWTLTFFSHNYYFVSEMMTAVDVYAWTVTGGPNRAATWERKTIADRVLIPLS